MAVVCRSTVPRYPLVSPLSVKASCLIRSYLPYKVNNQTFTPAGIDVKSIDVPDVVACDVACVTKAVLAKPLHLPAHKKYRPSPRLHIQ